MQEKKCQDNYFDFFNQSQRTVISFICYYLDNNILKKHAFTVISEFLSHIGLSEL
jgi:hypothetical protein